MNVLQLTVEYGLLSLDSYLATHKASSGRDLDLDNSRQEPEAITATGPPTVPAAPPIKYVLGYRSRTLNSNPITDPKPNPKNNKKRKRHRNKIEHRVISKSRFPMDEGGFIKGL